MIQSLFIVSGDSGDVILEKHYKGVMSRTNVELFWETVAKHTRRDDVPPIVVTPKAYLLNVYRGGLYLLGVSSLEGASLLSIEWLHRVYDTIALYLGEVTAKSITENFSTVYQLTDEMLDNGHPMITEPNALSTLIAPPSIAGRVANFVMGKVSNVKDTLGEGAMSVIPWRKSGVKYAQNEIYFDFIEEIDAIFESNGTLVSSDIRGRIECKCQLSGAPDVTLIFNSPSVIEDCSFHPCVRFARWERESVLSFVPPDGPFTLMTYRASDRAAPMPVTCRAVAGWKDGIGKASFTLSTKPMAIRSATGAGATLVGGGDIGLEDVKLTVTCPSQVRSTDFTADHGAVAVDPKTNDVTWTFRSFPREKSPELLGTLYLAPGKQALVESVSATLHFVCPGQSASGLNVKDLLLSSEKYSFVKGARTILKSGRVQIRT